jgi:hypothetical protein
MIPQASRGKHSSQPAKAFITATVLKKALASLTPRRAAHLRLRPSLHLRAVSEVKSDYKCARGKITIKAIITMAFIV